MTDYERETRTTRTDDLPPAETERVTYVRSGDGSATPWLIAAVVALVAIIAVAWLMLDSEPDDEEIAAAMEASRSAGYVEGANATMSQVPVTVPVPVPDTGAADYAARTAAEAAAAAAEARAAAERAAESADDAADNAAADNSVVGEPVG